MAFPKEDAMTPLYTANVNATGGRAGGKFVADVTRAILPERDRDEYEDDLADDGEDPLAVADGELPEPIIVDRTVPNAAFAGDTERMSTATGDDADEAGGKKKRSKKREPVTTEVDLPPMADAVSLPEVVEAKGAGKKKKPKIEIVDDVATSELPLVAEPVRVARGSEAPPVGEALAVVAAAPVAPAAAGGAPLIVEPRFKHADKAEMAAKENILIGAVHLPFPGIGRLRAR